MHPAAQQQTQRPQIARFYLDIVFQVFDALGAELRIAVAFVARF